jgi:23S rRNA pseudouridine1911/1915/1917 synthase
MHRKEETYCCQIAEEHVGLRLDRALGMLLPQFSRNQIQQWIRAGKVSADGNIGLEVRQAVSLGQEYTIVAECVDKVTWLAEPMDLPIYYEDSDILIINKPAGLVVHPGAGQQQGTLANGLLDYDKSLQKVPRAGIVHRLDKDTTGLMVVARNKEAQFHLVQQIEQRKMQRNYLACVWGRMLAGGTVKTPYGRHHKARLKMAVLAHAEREAITHYRVEKRFGTHTLVKLTLDTGRTHQIRVHMQHLGYPVMGDVLYGGMRPLPKSLQGLQQQQLLQRKGQLLHACSLSFLHPRSEKQVEWQADIPGHFAAVLQVLSQDSKS